MIHRPALNPQTVREVLGPRPTAYGLRLARLAILEALRLAVYEKATGHIGARPLRVGGRPLGDWIGADTLAVVLRRADPDQVLERAPTLEET
jgi:hypothetical protein